MVYFLGYFALMINNINYSDDYYRSATGQFDFFLFSRYMSEYLSKFIYLSEHRNSSLASNAPFVDRAFIYRLYGFG